MDDYYRSSLSTVEIDVACYRSVLITASRRLDVPKLGIMVDQILATMKDKQMVPDADCYGAIIRTWKNCAINPHAYVKIQRFFGIFFDDWIAKHHVNGNGNADGNKR